MLSPELSYAESWSCTLPISGELVPYMLSARAIKPCVLALHPNAAQFSFADMSWKRNWLCGLIAAIRSVALV